MKTISKELHTIGEGILTILVLSILIWFFRGVFYFFEPLEIGNAFKIILTILFGGELLIWLMGKIIMVIGSVFKFFGKELDWCEDFSHRENTFDIEDDLWIIMTPFFLIGGYLVIIFFYWVFVQLVLENPTLLEPGQLPAVINNFELVKESHSFYINSFQQKPITTLLASGGILFAWYLILFKVFFRKTDKDEIEH